MHPRDTGRQYDAIASFWDQRRRESKHGVTFLERAISTCKSRVSALDVGCGSGGPMLAMLLSAGFRVTGLDVSGALLKLAKDRYPAVEFLHDDFVEWQSDLRYDLVLAWDSVFHVPHDLQAAATQKLCRLLAPAGVLLFTAGGIDGEIAGTMNGHEFHYASLSETTLMELIRRNGCTPVLMDRDQFPHHHLVVMAVSEEADS